MVDKKKLTPLTPATVKEIARKFKSRVYILDPDYMSLLDPEHEALPIAESVAEQIIKSIIKNPSYTVKECVEKMWDSLPPDYTSNPFPPKAKEIMVRIFDEYEFDRTPQLKNKIPKRRLTPTEKRATERISDSAVAHNIKQDIFNDMENEKLPKVQNAEKYIGNLVDKTLQVLIKNPKLSISKALDKANGKKLDKDIKKKLVKIFERYEETQTAEPTLRKEVLQELRGTDDPIEKYLGISPDNPEYKPTEEYLQLGNAVSSAKETVTVLKVANTVGKYFFIFGLLMSVYALHIDTMYHMGKTFKEHEWLAWIFAGAVAIAITLLAKFFLKGVINQKFKDKKKAWYLLIFLSIFFYSIMLFFHFRFGSIIAKQNTEIIQIRNLSKKNTSVGEENLALKDDIIGLKKDQKDKKAEIKGEEKRLQDLYTKAKDLDAEYKKYLNQTGKKAKKKRQAVYQLQEKNKIDIASQQTYIKQLKEEYEKLRDTVSDKKIKKVKHIEKYEKALESNKIMNAVFVWVILGVIEILGLMSVVGQILAIFLLPPSLKNQLQNLGWNDNIVDMVTKHIKQYQHNQIVSHDIRLKQEIEQLQVQQAINSSHTNAITETIAHNAIENQKTLKNAIFLLEDLKK